MDDATPFKLAAVAAALARDPSLYRDRGESYEARGLSGTTGGYQQGGGVAHGLAGAWPTGRGGDTLDRPYQASPVISGRARRRAARHDQTMTRIRKRWKLIGWASVAVGVFWLALVLYEVASR